MSSPYPSRKNAQAGEASEQAAGDGSLRSVLQWTANWVGNVGRSEARAWAWGLGAIGTLLFFGLLGAGLWLSKETTLAAQTVPGVLDSVEVSGRRGRQPIVVLTAPVDVSATKVRVERIGQGKELEEDTPVLLSITAFDGETGEVLNPDGEPNVVVADLNEAELGKTLSSLLVGKSEGTRLLVARPLTSGGTEIDVVDVLATTATGDACDESGPLAVTVESGSLAVERTVDEPPDGLVVQCLVKGDGGQIRAGDEVVLQYLAGTWSDGAVTSSTWSDGVPTLVNLDNIMAGLSEALVDRRVGSRLAVTIPPDMATGEDTMFAVVDILAVSHASEAP